VNERYIIDDEKKQIKLMANEDSGIYIKFSEIQEMYEMIHKTTVSRKIFPVIPECDHYREDGTCKREGTERYKYGCNEIWCTHKIEYKPKEESVYKTDFSKDLWYCTHCGHEWEEFLALKCPNCDRIFGIKKKKLNY